MEASNRNGQMRDAGMRAWSSCARGTSLFTDHHTSGRECISFTKKRDMSAKNAVPPGSPYDVLSYREIQAECKRRGLKAVAKVCTLYSIPLYLLLTLRLNL